MLLEKLVWAEPHVAEALEGHELCATFLGVRGPENLDSAPFAIDFIATEPYGAKATGAELVRDAISFVGDAAATEKDRMQAALLIRAERFDSDAHLFCRLEREWAR